MMIRNSAVLALLLFSTIANAEDMYYNNNNNGNYNTVNNFGGGQQATATTTTNFPNNNNGSGMTTYTNSNGNSYTNTYVPPQQTYNTNEQEQEQEPIMFEEHPNDLPTGSNPFGGMQDQTDDFMSALGMYGGDMMTMVFGQCLNNLDINKMTDDPFADVKKRCTDQQAATFNSALDTFKTCAGFDLKELIEDLGSVYIGILMNCGSYAMDVSQELDDIGMGLEDMEKLKSKESPLPRVPQECVDALVGDNPFGTAFLYAEEFPEREQKCFSELAGKLPMCALSEWPVPIVGSWLSAFSCIYGNAQDVIMPLMQDSITSELKMLNDCIPAQISTSNCKEIRNKCLFDFDMPAVSMALPPPFWNPPMAQNCKDIASNQFGDLMDRYESFRQTCVPAADLAIWDIAAGHKDKNKGVSGGASYYMEESSDEEGDAKKKEKDTAVEETASESLSAAAPAAAAPASSGGGSTKFMPGLLTGMIVAFAAMFGYNKYRNGNGQMPIGNVGYQFNSLELSEGPGMFS